jgi:hypothetical protein
MLTGKGELAGRGGEESGDGTNSWGLGLALARLRPVFAMSKFGGKFRSRNRGAEFTVTKLKPRRQQHYALCLLTPYSTSHGRR